jgi:nucleoside 2-deoxyribosyltransferase
MAEIKPFAFVLMPFESTFDDIYRLGIKASCESLGVVAERVDEQRFSETMLDRIYRQIQAADFIIADMTGKNANVFYEVGYAHAKGKRCSLLTQEATDIPFDLKHHRHIVYGSSIQKLKSDLEGELAWQLQQLSDAKNHPISVDIKKPTGRLECLSYKDIGRIELTVELSNLTDRKSPEIEAIYLHTGPSWEFTQDGNECPTRLDKDSDIMRTFLKPPVARLASGAWAQIKLHGEKTLWTKWSGKEQKGAYELSGFVKVEVTTSEGSFIVEKTLDLTVDEIPF